VCTLEHAGAEAAFLACAACGSTRPAPGDGPAADAAAGSAPSAK